MKIIALERELPEATAEGFKAHAEAEARRAWQLHQEGVIRELYFRADRSDAVLVLECEDVAAAHAVLQTLPLVANGLITFDLVPLKAYPGFARLFTK
jgi:muconolactone delta-isomerase